MTDTSPKAAQDSLLFDLHRAADDFLSEWLDEQSLEDLIPYEQDPAAYAAMPETLAEAFATNHAASATPAALCRAVFRACLAASGGLVYVPDLDGGPCVATAEQLRCMTFLDAETWDDAIRLNDARRL